MTDGCRPLPEILDFAPRDSSREWFSIFRFFECHSIVYDRKSYYNSKKIIFCAPKLRFSISESKKKKRFDSEQVKPGFLSKTLRISLVNVKDFLSKT